VPEARFLARRVAARSRVSKVGFFKVACSQSFGSTPPLTHGLSVIVHPLLPTTVCCVAHCTTVECQKVQIQLPQRQQQKGPDTGPGHCEWLVVRVHDARAAPPDRHAPPRTGGRHSTRHLCSIRSSHERRFSAPLLAAAAAGCFVVGDISAVFEDSPMLAPSAHTASKVKEGTLS